jgi:2-methylisocitrate lyase-like PEP mutase family enzyme
MPTNHVRTLREMLETQRGVLLPGAPNALAARVIADLGFEAVYLTGAGVTNMHLGLPDLGFMDLTQLVEHTMAIRGVVDLPLIVDADTGFGNALNVAHTVKTLEQAEMVNKVKAAVESRRNGLVVIARTDACAVEGFEAAIERASRYIDAGADMTFVEAPENLAELKQVPKRLSAPQMLNIVLGGKTPIVNKAAAAEMGFSLVLYANAALQGAVQGMQAALRALRDKGVLDEGGGLIASFAERQRLVDKPRFDEMERRYAHAV